MTSWLQFEQQAPELAAFGRARFGGGVAYLGTVRGDGGPRVHPVTPIIGEQLFLFMEPTSPKGQDLRRDGRYTLHCTVEDMGGGGGEFYVRGRAALSDDPDPVSYTHLDVYKRQGLHFGGAKVPWVALAKIPDKSFNPIDVCLLGAQAIVFEANLAPYLIQKTRCRARLATRRYGVHFLGPTKKVQVTDEYQLSTLPVFFIQPP